MRKRSVTLKKCFCITALWLSWVCAWPLSPAFAADAITTGKLTPDASRLWSPARLAVDQAGALYVADPYKNRVQVFDARGVLQKTIRMTRPSAVATSSDGRLYIGSHDSYSVAILKDGAVTGYLGSGRNEFQSISDIAVDAAEGDVYVADPKANSVRIYTASGAVKGRLGGFTAPVAVAVASGGIFVLDAPSAPCSTTLMVKGVTVTCDDCSGQCSSSRITLLDKTGTPVRSVTESGEQTANSNMVRPVALAGDSLGNVYVADTFRKAVLVYNGALAFVGAMASPQDELHEPVSLGLSRDNSLYVSSSENRSIVEIGLAGMLHTAPTGTLTFQSASGVAVAPGVLGY